MPIPQETIAEPAAPTSDITKIKEKPLPTTDATEKPTESPAVEEKEAVKEEITEGNGKAAGDKVEAKLVEVAEEAKESVDAGKESAGAEEKLVDIEKKSEDKSVDAERKSADPEKKSEEKSVDAEKKSEEKLVDVEKKSEEKSEDAEEKLVVTERKSEEKSADVEKKSENKTVDAEKISDEKLVDAEKKSEEKLVDVEKKSEAKLVDAEKESEEKSADAEEKLVDAEKKSEDKSADAGKKSEDKSADAEKKSEEKSVDAEKSSEEAMPYSVAPSTPKKSENTSAAMADNPDLTPKKAEAFNLLAQGKRHYFVKDYESAVETLGEVCDKLVAIYGEKGTEMGDVYYYYGISLLELAREEANLLNVDKDKEGDEEEEEDEEMEEEKDDGKPGGGIGEKKIGDDEEKEVDAEDSNEKSNGEGADVSAVVDETLKDGETTMEEDEDVSNLQLAWEMLELARSIYFEANNEIKLADIYLKLSEVSMESENYPAAIEDLEKGLAIYEKTLDEHHRNIAEAYYKLGMAHANNDNYAEAVKQFNNSKEVLTNRIDSLKATDKKNSELSKDPFYKKESEIAELESLLPEIAARIEECNSDNKEIKKVISNFIGGKRPVSDDGAGPSSAGDTSSSSGASSSAKPASDISHLVKKKRKPEDSVEKTDEVEGKKIKLAEANANEKLAETPQASGEDVEMKSTAAEAGKTADE